MQRQQDRGRGARREASSPIGRLLKNGIEQPASESPSGAFECVAFSYRGAFAHAPSILTTASGLALASPGITRHESNVNSCMQTSWTVDYTAKL